MTDNAAAGVRRNDTHLKSVGYLLWVVGFTGAHRFYYGRPISGTLWFFTLGLLGVDPRMLSGEAGHA